MACRNEEVDLPDPWHMHQDWIGDGHLSDINFHGPIFAVARSVKLDRGFGLLANDHCHTRCRFFSRHAEAIR